ncbi:Factor of DNA methylation 3 [Bienertia sinuspersici]
MEMLSSPTTCIIHNLPIHKKFITAWNHHGFKGYGFIEFGIEDEDFKQALKLERKFHQEGHPKAQWMSRNTDAWPYLWAATCNNRHILNQNRANTEAEANILDAFRTIKIWMDNMMDDE